jgi:potassium-transporting ATPase KdpC subunit
MKQNLRIAILFTLVSTVIFGLIYPLAVTGLAQLLFPAQANGSLITKNGQVVGSQLLGQAFSSPGYFRTRPSDAGTGYDASQSGAFNYGPTNHQLIDRVKGDVAKLHAENPTAPIPVDLVTASGSGLDPEISPAAAEFQIPRVARERNIPENDVRALVSKHTLGRQFGFLGEPRVRVLELNLDLDATYPKRSS